MSIEGFRMSQPSKAVADRIAISRTVVESLKQNAPEIAEGLERVFFPSGVPQHLKVADIVFALRNALSHATETMLRADAAHQTELADDIAPRALLEQRSDMLKAFLISLRATLISTYGSTVASAYAIPPQIPDDPEVLLRVAIGVERLLRERSLVETPKIKSLAIAPLAVAEDLAVAIAELRRALSEVTREQREALVSETAREKALIEWFSTYIATAEVACGLFTLSGHPELAEGLRPTSRRLSGLPEEEDTAPATERRTVAA
jgi:hypothetical protein